ncbi:hypothetical protein RCL1_007766 [Eukaryota sp. TZLM3-RCL]
MGADIVVGDGGSLASPCSFGGPSVGFFATRSKFLRNMPGRLVGQTVDKEGKRSFCLTLGTREQHIKREKATSNICTSAGIMALSLSIHLSILGETGFKGLATVNHALASSAVDCIRRDHRLMSKGVRVVNNSFFNEFLLELPEHISAKQVVNILARDNILCGVPVSKLFGEEFDRYLLVAVTEKTTKDDVKALVDGLASVL